MKIVSMTADQITLSVGDRETYGLMAIMRSQDDVGLYWKGPTNSEWWQGWDELCPNAMGRYYEGTRFTLTDEHVTLLKASYTGWQYCEFGAVEINPKRPYGNSDVLGDMAEILGVERTLVDDWDELSLSEEQEQRLMRLHRETQPALEILIQTGGYLLGTYVRESNGWSYGPWVLED